MRTPPGALRPFVGLPHNIAPLGYRNFALYFVGHATSKFGRAVEDTGAVWLTYELTESPALLGLLGIARAVPAIALGPIAGVISDRVDQRKLLLLTQGLALLASLALGLLVLTGRVELWHVYVQAAIRSGIAAFDGAVREALFPRLVPRPHLAEAVALTAIAARLSAFVGPVVGGVAIAGFGAAAPFLLNAALFPVLMAAVTFMRGVVPRTATAGSTIRGEFMEGLRYILAAPVLSGILKIEVVFEVFQMNAVMITIVGRQGLDVGPEGLGVLLAAPALGSLTGVGSLIIFGQARRQGRFAVYCTFAYAAALMGFAASREFGLSFAVLALLGILDSFLTVNRHSIMQLSAPSHMRGRVMGNMGTVTRGAMPLAETQSGVLAGLLGGPLAVVAAAVALTAATGATALTNRALWRFSRDDALRESDDATATSPPEDLRAP